MSGTTRTFVALPIPADRRAALAALQREIAGEWPGIRWADPAGLHLTLAFLGDLADDRQAEVGRAVAMAAAGASPFGLEIARVGAFPAPRRPRVVWAGVEGPDLPRLDALQRAVVAELRAIGLAPADPRFHPHITLGRPRPGRARGVDPASILGARASWSGGPLAVTEVVTYASVPGRYQARAKAPLDGPKPESPP